MLLGIDLCTGLLLRLGARLELIAGLDGGFLLHLRLQEGQLGIFETINVGVSQLISLMLLQCGFNSERLNALDEVSAAPVLIIDHESSHERGDSCP